MVGLSGHRRKLSEASMQLWAGAAIATSGLSLKLQNAVFDCTQ